MSAVFPPLSCASISAPADIIASYASCKYTKRSPAPVAEILETDQRRGSVWLLSDLERAFAALSSNRTEGPIPQMFGLFAKPSTDGISKARLMASYPLSPLYLMSPPAESRS